MKTAVVVLGFGLFLSFFLFLFLRSPVAVLMLLLGPLVVLIGFALPKGPLLPLMGDSWLMTAAVAMFAFGVASLVISMYFSFVVDNHAVSNVTFVLPFVLIPLGAVLSFFVSRRMGLEPQRTVPPLQETPERSSQESPSPVIQDSSPQPQVIVQVREREIIREIVKIPCRHCGTLLETTASFCQSCGAPMR